MRMVVKKHRMTRDAQGQLVDTTDSEDDQEGWHFYVREDGTLPRSLLKELKTPAIIF